MTQHMTHHLTGCILQEEEVTRPWSDTERRIFMDKFLLHPKDFRKIATFLEGRTTGECIKFFYERHLGEDFSHVRPSFHPVLQATVCHPAGFVTCLPWDI